MDVIEPYSPPTDPERPRHLHEEVADLLAAGILRLRTAPNTPQNLGEFANTATVDLGFSGHQRVNANPYQEEGVRA